MARGRLGRYVNNVFRKHLDIETGSFFYSEKVVYFIYLFIFSKYLDC